MGLGMLAVLVSVPETDETLKLGYQITFPQRCGRVKKTLSESAVPGVTHSGALVPHMGCGGKTEEPLLKHKGRKRSRENRSRTMRHS